jgi:hypothetical protein
VSAPREKRSRWKKWLLFLVAIVVAFVTFLSSLLTWHRRLMTNAPGLRGAASGESSGQKGSAGGGRRIPKGAIKIRKGYALVNPPSEGFDGSIVVLDNRGAIIERYSIPYGPPAVSLPEPHTFELPWWYANLSILLSVIGLGLMAILFASAIRLSRRRARETLSITLYYLNGLATKD